MPKKLTDDERQAKVQLASHKMLVWLGVLQTHRLRVSFTDDLAIESRPGAVAQVEDDYPYHTIDIMYKRSWIDQADLEVVCEVTLHEILHVAVFGPFERYLDEREIDYPGLLTIEEHAVDLITLWMSRMGSDLGDKAWET